ncbi:radical SAM family heme chaperone HemW [Caminibacter mediatlanticus]|uniref:Heme chaperone HemW n=1 Tax=Caminibacter mediatlanticus TB-2 TaxID=391592 RepID=A0AAI9AHG2_9BACT|nr:radical SAM family heme chaperone HemW [Caminibacter mediatlanticus]EDM23713.1 coproporphyrinogen III oxidase [Caminibacter mediatlanticus TB-2]
MVNIKNNEIKKLNNSQFSILNSRLLYIHIPFCDSKCHYCAFNSYTNLNHLKKEYFNAIKTQIENDINKSIQFKTLFIGGGTPSTMKIDFYEKLMKLLEYNLKDAIELTIECNPNVTIEWLKEIKNLGFNRISFGVQSFDEEKLKFLNRNHSPIQAIHSIENAQKVGFENINLDLIYSTSLDNNKLLENDLKTTFSLPITHISAYSLMIEENTKWEGDYSKRKYDENLEIWFIEKIKEKFPQYEISNFGKPCIHNLGYWKLNEYIGIGAGAVGFLQMENGKWKMENEELRKQISNKQSINLLSFRYYTQNNVYEYLKNPCKYKYEMLTDEDIKKEKIFLGLRSIIGFEENILNNKEKTRVKHLIEENKLYKKENRIYSLDFLLADAITSYILD